MGIGRQLALAAIEDMIDAYRAGEPHNPEDIIEGARALWGDAEAEATRQYLTEIGGVVDGGARERARFAEQQQQTEMTPRAQVTAEFARVARSIPDCEY